MDVTSPTTPRRTTLVAAFPAPGRRVELAYRELDLAEAGTVEQRQALGEPNALPRPWDPPTCRDPRLRGEVWAWLEEVVTWLNHEYVWDASGTIPACWPRHPHIVHEVAVIADLRRRAGTAFTADLLEEWHRYALPAFLDRMRGRLHSSCDDGTHQQWPAAGRYARHNNADTSAIRARLYELDSATLTAPTGP